MGFWGTSNPTFRISRETCVQSYGLKGVWAKECVDLNSLLQTQRYAATNLKHGYSHTSRLELGPQQKIIIIFAWLVKNNWNTQKQKSNKGS